MPNYALTLQPDKKDRPHEVDVFEAESAKAAAKGHRLEPPRWSYRRWDYGGSDVFVSCCLNDDCSAAVTWENDYGFGFYHQLTTALEHQCPYHR